MAPGSHGGGRSGRSPTRQAHEQRTHKRHGSTSEVGQMGRVAPFSMMMLRPLGLAYATMKSQSMHNDSCVL